MSNNEQNIELAITAKALRTSFNTLSTEIMNGSCMDDKWVIAKVRRMQTEHKLFHKLVENLRESDYELYEKELLS
jgi:ribosomal protein L17